MPEIYIMMKPVSGLCNMRCKYCFYMDELKHREQAGAGRMTEETLENVIRKALSFAEGRCTFAFQGGEPTLAGLDFYEKCLELQEKYKNSRTEVQNVLQTNGYGLTEAWGHFFAKHHFLVGVSLDGLKSLHDSYRRDAAGGDTYLRVLEGIRMLERCGVEFNILTVVHNRTASKIRRIYEQYAKWGFRHQQYIACLEPIGEKPGEQIYSLSPQAYGRFLTELFGLWEQDFWEGKQPYIRQFENWLGILLGEQPEACEMRGVCGIQNIVEADGSVYPCDFYALDEYLLGNLNTDGMEDIYRRWDRLEFGKSSRNQDGECVKCCWFPLCRGGCRRLRGSRQQPDGGWRNDYCESYRMFFEQCYDRLIRMRNSF